MEQNFDLAYIHEAIAQGKKRIEVLFRVFDSSKQMQEPIWLTKFAYPQTALTQLSKPFDKRVGGWKNMYPANYNKQSIPIETQIPLSAESLLNPELLKELAANPDFLKALKDAQKDQKKEAKEEKEVQSFGETQPTNTEENA